jgi:25S rRNA (uracil2634-N3)-methyltransferase
MGKKRRLATRALVGAAAVCSKPEPKRDDDNDGDNDSGGQSLYNSKQTGGGEGSERTTNHNQQLVVGVTTTRSTDRLYTSHETLECAMNNGCVPCAYKIGCFDVALDKEFCKAVPNQRPEQCPRSSCRSRQYVEHNNSNSNDNNGVLGFRRGMSILTVGDGDFTFSLGLARKLLPDRDDKTKTFLVATSYESESTLRRVYPDFETTLCELHELGVRVAYNVDATRILETLTATTLPPPNNDDKDKSENESLERRFHRICWNFPCTAIGRGQDGQNTAMEENKELVRKFVESSRSVLTDKGDGELYVCHKTKPPFNQWNLEEVALEHQTEDTGTKQTVRFGRRPLLRYSGRIVLDRFLLPPYTPRKALDKKSFPCHDACFYVFAHQQREDKGSAMTTAVRQKTTIFAPTIPRNGGASENGNNNTAARLIKIEPDLIRTIRRTHLKKDIHPRKKKRKRTGKSKAKGGFALQRF